MKFVKDDDIKKNYTKKCDIDLYSKFIILYEFQKTKINEFLILLQKVKLAHEFLNQ